MKRTLVVFVDALGPDQLARFPAHFAPFATQGALEGILGYSSGALATLLTGAPASEHGRMCLFSRAQGGDSILKPLRWLGLLPKIVHERGRVRRAVARIFAKAHDLRGYVSLHRVPPSAFHELDLPERDDLFAAEQIGAARTFLADGRAAGLDVLAAPWQLPEEARWSFVHDALSKRAPALTFLYAAELDGALHQEGDDGPKSRAARARIADHVARVRDRLAKDGDVATLVVGDHGMAKVGRVVDPAGILAEIGTKGIFVDSTMLRVWGDASRIDRLARIAERHALPGRLLRAEDLATRKAPVEKAPYGDAIFLLDEGTIFAPSWVGGRAAGMHGYDVGTRSSLAAFATDLPIDVPRSLQDVASIIRARTIGAA